MKSCRFVLLCFFSFLILHLTAGCEDSSSNSTPTPPTVSPQGTCGDPNGMAAQSEQLKIHFDYLTQGVPESPITEILDEDSNGTLRLGLNENVFPILTGDSGLFAAASQLGQGRIVAFSGQDFISSYSRSSFLENEAIKTLLQNATQWVGKGKARDRIEVVSDNAGVKLALHDGGFVSVKIPEFLIQMGLWETRDWRIESLATADVVVVQVNEWGTLHVDPDHIDDLRSFVENGGGLIIAGSAMHWSWWLSDSAPEYIGNTILKDTGIQFDIASTRDLNTAKTIFDPLATPASLWCSYIAGDAMEPNQLARVAGLFEAAKEINRDDELNQGLERLIADTPALPASATDPEARLAANVAASLPPHEWPMPHPWTSTFPGLPAESATPSSLSATLDLKWSGARPLGAYAAPGTVVKVTVPESILNNGYVLRVGELYDDLRSIDGIDSWKRAPMMRQEFPVNQITMVVGNPLGGNISLVVPKDQSGEIEVAVDNALTMLVYTRGESQASDWQPGLDNGTPQIILQDRGHVRMVVFTEGAKAVTDPDAVIDFWTGFHSKHIELASEPTPRMFESHWIFDIHVGWGYANATSNRITFPHLSQKWALRTETGEEDWWLFGHELGHQFQTSDWSGGDITEVCVNLFTMYTLNYYINNGGDNETLGFNEDGIDHEGLKASRWATADLFGKLQLYRQLVFEFGWDSLKQTMASYYDESYPRDLYGDFMDGFAIRYSALVQKDLAGFFEHWEYPMSDYAASRIRSFNHPEWLPPGW